VALTERGVLPPNSVRVDYDPYEDKAAAFRLRCALVIVIAATTWLVASRVFHLWPF